MLMLAYRIIVQSAYFDTSAMINRATPKGIVVGISQRVMERRNEGADRAQGGGLIESLFSQTNRKASIALE